MQTPTEQPRINSMLLITSVNPRSEFLPLRAWLRPLTFGSQSMWGIMVRAVRAESHLILKARKIGTSTLGVGGMLDWGLERLNNLPDATQLGRVRSGLKPRCNWPQTQTLSHTSTLIVIPRGWVRGSNKENASGWWRAYFLPEVTC